MSQLTIETFILGPDETNCYLISSGKRCVVIDAGVEPQRLIERISELGLTLEGIFITHFHLDHVGGVRQLVDHFAAPVYASEKDQFLKEISFEAEGLREFSEHVDFPFQVLEPGRMSVLGQTMMVLDTPGHTPGSLSFFFPAAGCVFVGDLIFMIAVGRTNLPRGSSSDLLVSVRSRIFVLPEETWIYSGHGPRSTVKHEKANNPHFIFS